MIFTYSYNGPDLTTLFIQPTVNAIEGLFSTNMGVIMAVVIAVCGVLWLANMLLNTLGIANHLSQAAVEAGFMTEAEEMAVVDDGEGILPGGMTNAERDDWMDSLDYD